MKKTGQPSRTRAIGDVTIPEREAIMTFLLETGKPCTRNHIAEQFEMHKPGARRALERRLQAMIRDGQLVKNRRGRYGRIDKMDLISGKVIAHPDGYGFLVPDQGGGDLFLPAWQMRSLLHGDRALARLVCTDHKGKREGALVEVLERANEYVVGRFYKEGNVRFVTPYNTRLNQDILIPQDEVTQAKQGEFVVVQITQQPGRRTQPIGKINERIGEKMSASMAADIAIRSYRLPYVWSDAVKAEARTFTQEIEPAELEQRQDLRDLPFVTIDGEDAHDFDDAVYCEQHGTQWRLFVAIADVAYYVKPGSALDKEAYERGNSVYFPRRVISMLPEVLSNKLCSLKPNVDRLSVVCVLDIDHSGEVQKYQFFKAVICSSARLTYTDMAAIVSDKCLSLRNKYNNIIDALDRLYSLYKLLHQHRKKQALIEFNTTETRFKFDKKGEIIDIYPLIRNDAHRIIEEFMLTANVAAADYLAKNKIAGLYRVHDTPSQEKLKEVRAFLEKIGLQLGGGDRPTTRDYAQLLAQSASRKDVYMIEMVLLRSVQLAVYSPENIGHFGLGFDSYMHFTSPIRRYSDLLSHRAIHYLLEKKDKQKFIYCKQDMEKLGAHCSAVERRAEEAVRDAVQHMKCMHVHQYVGQTFYGTISSVVAFGLFIELNSLYVEGLLHISALPMDYYHHDAIRHSLYGERTGKRFSLGDKIRIVIARVNIDERKIDLDLVEKEND